ncbi:glycosyltransferase family 2 protein [Paractinoplanes durhamensis]|uniref:glycosyltransferase family 2 protein n=1 Tax=Paractinoplanes durhamensis TaxID=113563 RepID=UPI00194526A3|nr:glycosyltransferase family 2 protein [Actinoplanes durhamensis]
MRDPGGLPLMLRGLPVVDEVIVVSDGPAAETAALVRSARPDALVIRPGRTGSGNALASGVAASSGDVVVTLNGDGSTDPGEIPRYIAALTEGADVAVGSRYRPGGRDLTGGRFRRGTNLVLIWIVNTLFGTDRTDPGFGYAAFWRDAIDRLDLPDPSARHASAWGDGPEIQPLLALRPEARGMRVTEVGSVAYPRMSRAERAGLRHWIRVIAVEFKLRKGRHTAPAVDPEATTVPVRPTWPMSNRQPTGEPLWGPPRRRPTPGRDLWRAGENAQAHTSTSTRPTGNGKSHSWRSGHPGRPDVNPRMIEAPLFQPPTKAMKPQPREVGEKRRRMEVYRQRPDLRVINGEGTGGPRTRPGRLRPVPREN